VNLPYYPGLLLFFVFRPLALHHYMEVTPQVLPQVSAEGKQRKSRHRPRYRNSTVNGNSADVSSVQAPNDRGEGSRRERGPPRDRASRKPRSQVTNGRVDAPSASGSRNPTVESAPGAIPLVRETRNSEPHNRSKQTNEFTSAPEGRNRGPQANRRGAKFNATLTESSVEAAPSSDSTKQFHKYKGSAPKGNDLTSTLIHALSTPPYPDCPICFAAIHPAQPTWSCSPSHNTRASDDDSNENVSSQCCWTTFHLKCIRSWASKSVKEITDAWRARGEERPGEWRCPGCQSKREHVPNGYW
jgi:transcriptional repressor NF-X1